MSEPSHKAPAAAMTGVCEYILGRGWVPLTPPVNEGIAGMIEGRGVAYYIGGPLFVTWENAEAVEVLAGEVLECLRTRFT